MVNHLQITCTEPDILKKTEIWLFFQVSNWEENRKFRNVFKCNIGHVK